MLPDVEQGITGIGRRAIVLGEPALPAVVTHERGKQVSCCTQLISQLAGNSPHGAAPSVTGPPAGTGSLLMAICSRICTGRANPVAPSALAQLLSCQRFRFRASRAGATSGGPAAHAMCTLCCFRVQLRLRRRVWTRWRRERTERTRRVIRSCFAVGSPLAAACRSATRVYNVASGVW